MIKAVIYDLDGTVLDTISTISGYGNEALEKFGLKQFSQNEYKYFVGNGAKVLIERMLEACNVSRDEYFDNVYAYYNKIYNAAPIATTKPYDGIAELVINLKNQGIIQAILSNKPDYATKGAVAHFFKNGEFDCVYGGRDGIPLKPDAQALLSILKDMNVKPSECIFVGDTWVDIQTGKNAGAVTIGVLWGFRDRQELEENNADYIVSNPNEIFEIIKSINKSEQT